MNGINSLIDQVSLAYDKLADGVTIVDSNNCFMYVNPASEAMYGYSIDEMRGQPLSLIIPKEHKGISVNTVDAVPGKVWEGEVVRLRKSGEEFSAHLTLSLLCDDEGNAVATVAIVRDLSKPSRTTVIQNSLTEIGHIINSSLNVGEVYERFAAETSKLIIFDRISINLLCENGNRGTVAFNVGTDAPGRRIGDSFDIEGTTFQQVLTTRKGLITQGPDLEELTNRLPQPIPTVVAGIRSIITVPLISKDEAIGAITIRSLSPNAFSADDLRIAERIGIQISGSIANSQLHGIVEQQAEQRAVLSEIGKIVISSLDFNEVYEKLFEQVARLLSFDNLAINLIDLEAGTTWKIHNDKTQTVPGATRLNEVTTLVGTMNAEVAQTGRYLLFQVQTEEELIGSFPRALPFFKAGFRSFLTVPLVDRGNVIASLHLRSKSTDAYGNQDIAMLELIASQISSAVANSRLYEDLQRDAEERRIIAEIAGTVSSSLKIDDVYERFALQMKRLIPYDSLGIGLVDLESRTAVSVFRAGILWSERSTGSHYPIKGTLLEHAIDTKTATLISNSDEEELLKRFPSTAPSTNAGMKSYITVPMISGNTPIGSIALRSTTVGEFTKHHLDLAQRVADIVSGAVANSQLYTNLQREATERQLLADISRVVTSGSDLSEFFEQLSEIMHLIIPSDRIVLTNVDKETGLALGSYVWGMPLPNSPFGFDSELRNGSVAYEAVSTSASVVAQGEYDERMKAQFPSLADGVAKGLLSTMGVPLSFHDKPVAVIVFKSKTPNAYAERDVQLAERIGTQIAGAVANSQLYTDLQLEAEERAMFAEIARVVGSSLNFDDVFEKFSAEVGKFIPFDRITINTINANDSTTFVRFTSGVTNQDNATFQTLSLSGSITEEMTLKRCGLLIASADETFVQKYPVSAQSYDNGIRSYIVVPLISNDEIIGGLHIRSLTPGFYSNQHLALAERVASQAAGAVANSELHRKLQEAETQQRQLANENEFMAAIGRIVSSSLNLNDVYEQFASKVAELVPFDKITVNIIDAATDSYLAGFVAGVFENQIAHGQKDALLGSLVGVIYSSKLTNIVNAHSESDLSAKYPRLLVGFRTGLKSAIGVPIIYENQIIATLQLRSTVTDAYSHYHADILERVSSQIAGNIANSQLHEDVRHREEEASRLSRQEFVLAEIGRLFSSTGDVDDIYEQFAEQVRLLLPFDRLTVVLCNRDTQDATLAYLSGIDLPGWTRTNETFQLSKEQFDEMFNIRMDRPYASKPDDKSNRYLAGVSKGLHSLVESQLVSDNEIIGSFRVWSKLHNAYSEDEITVIKRISDQISGAVANAQLNKEREAVEFALAESQKELANILETADDAILSLDENYRIVLYNLGAQNTFGYSLDEVIGKNLDMLLPEDVVVTHRSHISGFSTSTESTRKMDRREDIRGRRKNGEVFPAEASISKIESGGRKIFTVFLRDITERKLLENQFLQAQKMETVGNLAGGVAHDFNNLLTGILSFTSFAQAELPSEGEVSEYLEQVERAGERAATLTRQLLGFSRRQIMSPKVLNLNEVVLDLDRMLRRLVTEDIEITIIPDEDIGMVEVDPGQVEQLLMNLVVNASDAITEVGNIVISTANFTCDAAFVRLHPDLSIGEYVSLSVNDSGEGIPNDVLDHIFEPFYTTKEIGKGTGLGLSTCYGIAAQSGGAIVVESELSAGSTFTLYLPKLFEDPEPVAEVHELTVSSAGHETMFIVEDDIIVRTVAVMVLKKQGYRVLEATNGLEALDIAKSEDTIDLLLTDIVMPLMSGRRLAEEFNKIHPETKIVYASGYTDDTIVRAEIQQEARAFIQKPFTPSTLANSIRTVLDE